MLQDNGSLVHRVIKDLGIVDPVTSCRVVGILENIAIVEL